MGSGCENPIADISPSSATQLPILAALHAGSSTLFGNMIHDTGQKVNPLFTFFGFLYRFIRKWFFCRPKNGKKSREILCTARRFRGFSHCTGGKMGLTIDGGGSAVQCQKLKTYMETGRVVFLPAKAIRPNPAQPRKVFRQEALEELAESIRQHGILQPLSVRRVGLTYELIAGERRLRAGQMAGLTEIPCIIMNMDDKESGMTALVENLQRQDLDFIEEARGISYLMEQWSMSQEQTARIIGKSQSAVANKLRILRHSPQVLEALRAAGLTERHARALLKLGSEPEKLAAISVIAQLSMGVARTERYIEELLAGRQKKPAKASVGAFLNNVNQSLARIQLSGIPAVSERRETESQIVLTITIPK